MLTREAVLHGLAVHRPELEEMGVTSLKLPVAIKT
jgi:hypothetical protein